MCVCGYVQFEKLYILNVIKQTWITSHHTHKYPFGNIFVLYWYTEKNQSYLPIHIIYLPLQTGHKFLHKYNIYFSFMQSCVSHKETLFLSHTKTYLSWTVHTKMICAFSNFQYQTPFILLPVIFLTCLYTHFTLVLNEKNSSLLNTISLGERGFKHPHFTSDWPIYEW